MEDLRSRLKNCQPYWIEKELLPNLYFVPSENDIEYWIFKYYFVTRLNTLAIGVRVGYTRQHVLSKLKDIIRNNEELIKQFLELYLR